MTSVSRASLSLLCMLLPVGVELLHNPAQRMVVPPHSVQITDRLPGDVALFELVRALGKKAGEVRSTLQLEEEVLILSRPPNRIGYRGTHQYRSRNPRLIWEMFLGFGHRVLSITILRMAPENKFQEVVKVTLDPEFYRKMNPK